MESRDLRIWFTFAVKSVRRFLDSLTLARNDSLVRNLLRHLAFGIRHSFTPRPTGDADCHNLSADWFCNDAQKIQHFHSNDGQKIRHLSKLRYSVSRMLRMDSIS